MHFSIFVAIVNNMFIVDFSFIFFIASIPNHLFFHTLPFDNQLMVAVTSNAHKLSEHCQYIFPQSKHSLIRTEGILISQSTASCPYIIFNRPSWSISSPFWIGIRFPPWFGSGPRLVWVLVPPAWSVSFLCSPCRVPVLIWVLGDPDVFSI